MLRVYSNTAPFYVRDLSILRFWYLDSILETMTQGSQGKTIVYFFFSYQNSLNFLFWPKYLAGNSSKMLNGRGESGILILFLILEESFKRSMTLLFSRCHSFSSRQQTLFKKSTICHKRSMTQIVDFQKVAFVLLRKFPPISSFLVF